MINIFWFRRDLRLHDNHALYQCLQAGLPVLPIFIFDKNILNDLKEGEKTLDKRLIYIHRALEALNEQLQKFGSTILTVYDEPETAIHNLITEFEVANVFANRDYEPYAIKRDQSVEQFLTQKDIGFKTFKDQVIFEQAEVVKDDGKPYSVFTPYSRKWKKTLSKEALRSYDVSAVCQSFLSIEKRHVIDLDSMGFIDAEVNFPSSDLDRDLVKAYNDTRNFPAIAGTSRLGVHLRFGTISTRQLARFAIQQRSETYLNELIWREFYMMILWHYPHVVNKAFKPAYDNIPWRTDVDDFKKWCAGKTGYPLVDAGMRELEQTGFMHNRVRMVTASFLTKHLLIDWRMGEAWFAKKLLDFELSSNNGGWQWASGSGCDAAPYFRIFNPESQMKKFDKQKDYIRKWVPEYGTEAYPDPMVDHRFARERALSIYKESLAKRD